MSVFEKPKKQLTIIGIRVVPKQNLSLRFQDYQLTLNRIQVLCVGFLFGTYIITLFCTLMFKDIGFSGMSQAILYCIIGIVHFSFCFISTAKRSKIMALMDDLDDIIEKSMIKKLGKHFKYLPTIVTFVIWSYCREWKSTSPYNLQAIKWNGGQIFGHHLYIDVCERFFLCHSCCNRIVLQLFYPRSNRRGISSSHPINVSAFAPIKHNTIRLLPRRSLGFSTVFFSFRKVSMGLEKSDGLFCGHDFRNFMGDVVDAVHHLWNVYISEDFHNVGCASKRHCRQYNGFG